MDIDKLEKLARSYANISAEVGPLMEALWGGEAPAPKPAEPPAKTPAIPSVLEPAKKPETAAPTKKPGGGKRTGFEVPGYKRVRITPSKAIQQKSFQILTQNRHKPFGTQIPFEAEGKQYLAVIEEHPPSPRNRSYHPGVSLFVKPTPAVETTQGAFPSALTGELSKRTQQKMKGLNKVFQPQVQQLMQRGLAAGLRPEIVEGKRDQARQEQLYRKGRTCNKCGHFADQKKPPKDCPKCGAIGSISGKVVTWTKSSAHTKGLAVDIAQLDDKGKITYKTSPEFYPKMAEIAKSLGLMWGGDWKKTPDKPHFQWKPPKKASPGIVLNDMLRIYAESARKLMEVKPTPHEEEIFNVLREAVKAKTPDTTLRVAGGWVRDKLLGKESSDIDISPDNMSGEAFANLAKEYMEENGIAAGKVVVIKANPAQSKHLATATMKVLGQPIDFVQLRSETYADSRIPDVRPGTAQEDASRRDLTINALFYNLNTGEVEDLVGGTEDLKKGIARTPIDPVQTFLDDPLRILRTVRFASRLNLELDPSIIEATHKPEVQQAFRDKVSTNRIQQELVFSKGDKKLGEPPKPGALVGPDPARAARLLGELGFRDMVFEVLPEDVEALKSEFGEGEIIPFESEQYNPHHDLTIWGHTLKGLEEAVKLIRRTEKPAVEDEAVAYLTMVLHDVGKRYTGIHGKHEEGHRTYHDHARVSADLARGILNRINTPKDIIRRVCNLILLHMRLHDTAGKLGPKALRKIIGKIGNDYKILVQLSQADALGKTEISEEERAGFEERYQGFLPEFEKAQESMGGGTKPQRPISGHDLMQLGVKPGPDMGDIFRALDEELLRNPAMTKEEAIEFAKKML
jgi:tRNA nucleotidyltransferase (CCA-adding enzyme)